MYPILFSCNYFTFWSFGVCLFIGYAIYSYLLENDPIVRHYGPQKKLSELLAHALFVGLFFSRLVYVISEWNSFDSLLQMLSFNQGGLSLLGGIIGLLVYSAWAAHAYTFPLARIADRAALYAPIGQAIGRIGCFLSGCCHGIATERFWAITYTHPACAGELGVPVHPTQLYSVCLLSILFLFLWYLQKKQGLRPGVLTLIYLMLMSLERFSLDFLRADRIMTDAHAVLSFHQLLSAGLFCASGAAALFLLLRAPEPTKDTNTP